MVHVLDDVPNETPVKMRLARCHSPCANVLHPLVHAGSRCPFYVVLPSVELPHIVLEDCIHSCSQVVTLLHRSREINSLAPTDSINRRNVHSINSTQAHREKR